MRRLIIVIFICSALISCSKPQTTVIIDDVVQSKEHLQKLDSSEIFSYSKWLPGKAPKEYDQWKKNILIVIKTWKTERKLQKQRYELLNNYLDSTDHGADILIVQDGILIPPEEQKPLRMLSADQLRYVDTLELQAAKTLYGSEARQINLIINTYDPKLKYIP